MKILGKFQDLTGRVFGRWKVLRISHRKNGKIMYLCECSCEAKTQRAVAAQHLTQGKSLSCGCLRKELNSIRFKKDMTGQKFGKLTVIKEAGRSGRKIDWLCQCECGNQKIINGGSLRQGLTKSCGCIKSYGEQAIKNILTIFEIPFEIEKGFDDCRYPNTNFQAKFDFYVNNKYIIEYDGKQHFGIGGWNDKNNFLICQEHDTFKNEWCRKNNIPIIRIPYTVSPENIELYMLQPETSPYLLN